MIHLLYFISFYLKLLANKAVPHSMSGFKVLSYLNLLFLNLLNKIETSVFIIQFVIIFHYQINFFYSDYHVQSTQFE